MGMITSLSLAGRLCAGIALFVGFASAAHTAPEPARTADSFVDSMGHCTHWGYPDTPYGYAYDKVKTLLGDLGVRNIRDGYHERENDLFKTYGIKTTMIFGPGPPVAQSVATLRDHIDLVAMVEGPNEVDIFPTSANYQGQGYPAGPKHFQNDLYAAIKADPVTKNLGVIAPSLGRDTPIALAPLNSLDYEVMHSYAGGAHPSTSLDFNANGVSNILNANMIVGRGGVLKPIVVTESGYHTALGASTVIAGVQSGVSEKAQAKYIPRQFAEYFNHGIVRDFTYELVDEFPDYKTNEREGTNAEACFGIVRHDLTPKPAYYAEKNLIALLKEARWNAQTQQYAAPQFAPSALPFTLSGDTRNIHHTLLQKSNGDFYLLLWQEVSSFDTAQKQDIANPSVPVTLMVGLPLKSAATYLPGVSQTASQTFNAPKRLALQVPDEILVVRLTPAKSQPFTAEGPPQSLTADTTGTTADLRWTPAPGAKPSGYFVSRMGVLLGRASAPQFSDSNLVPGTGYTYTVAAYDAQGRVSAPASIVAQTKEAYPDLTVTDITWSPANAKPGEAVTFSATIKNQGNAPTPSGIVHGVAFFVDNTFVNWSDTFKGPLAPGESKTLTVNNGPKGAATWTVTAGTHAVQAFVDDLNRIVESNEDNNKMTKTWTVAGP